MSILDIAGYLSAGDMSPTSPYFWCTMLLFTSFFFGIWGAIHQLLSIILKLRILVLLPVSTMPYVVMVKNYS
jgi:hypothetical protein